MRAFVSNFCFSRFMLYIHRDITCIIDGVAGTARDAESDLENEAALVGCKKLVFFDDFEKVSDVNWRDGVFDSRSVSLSTFLGPFGVGQTGASREFAVPVDADRLTVEFVYYEIGAWNANSELAIMIGDTKLDMKEFDASIRKLEGLYGGIFWSRHRLATAGKLTYGSSTVLVHKVTLNVPSKFFSSGVLKVEFLQTMIQPIETESGGVDSFKITAYFANCEDGEAAALAVTVLSGAANTLWSDGDMTCPGGSIKLECFGDPTTNANTYPRTAHVRYDESYGGHVCTQDICTDCLGSITVDSVTQLEDGATLFDISSDDFIFTAFGIEAGGGFSSLELQPPLNENLGVGNVAEVNKVSHTEFCLAPIRGDQRKLLLGTKDPETTTDVTTLDTATGCHSAFAYFSQDKSICFKDLGFDADCGWSNGLFVPSTIPYSFDFYAGPENCKVGRGEHLGSLTLEYDGERAIVSYQATALMYLKETSTYVGKNFLPLDGIIETSDPSKFPILHPHDMLSGSSVDAFEVAGFSNDGISIVAFATICDVVTLDEKEIIADAIPAARNHQELRSPAVEQESLATPAVTVDADSNTSGSAVSDAVAVSSSADDSNHGLRGGTTETAEKETAWSMLGNSVGRLANLW
jgi:hypothetical protein